MKSFILLLIVTISFPTFAAKITYIENCQRDHSLSLFGDPVLKKLSPGEFCHFTYKFHAQSIRNELIDACNLGVELVQSLEYSDLKIECTETYSKLAGTDIEIHQNAKGVFGSKNDVNLEFEFFKHQKQLISACKKSALKYKRVCMK